MKLTRGYKHVREKVGQGNKFTMSCTNCKDYFQASGDKEEVCQNSAVLEYDMIIVDNRIYCLHWTPLEHTRKRNE